MITLLLLKEISEGVKVLHDELDYGSVTVVLHISL